MEYFPNRIFITLISLEAQSFLWVYPTLWVLTLQQFLSLYSIFFKMLVKTKLCFFWYVGITIFLWSSSVNSLPYGCLLPHGELLPINQRTWLFSFPTSLSCFRQIFGIHILSTKGFLSYYKIFPWASKNARHISVNEIKITYYRHTQEACLPDDLRSCQVKHSFNKF